MTLTAIDSVQVADLPKVETYLGDCLDVLASWPPASIEAAVTDPPYGLEFMGKSWDGADGFRRSLNKNDVDRENVFGRASRTSPEYRAGGFFQEFTQAWSAEVLRVLKPGGHLLAFGGSRTYHRMASGIEDAGFEIRDQIMWIYGQGFPKSRNLKGDWDGWGTALKPAHEPIVVARKPLVGTVAENVIEHGTGAINIDDCRVDLDGDYKSKPNGRPSLTGRGDNYNPAVANTADTLGRWPANVIHDGSDEVLVAFPEAPGQLADASTNSEQCKTQNAYGTMYRGRKGEPSADSANTGEVGFKMRPGMRRLDGGSAARFFYCAKASRKERGPENTHPTVKPIALMRYLCRLVTPPGGIVLDPFMGSGSTGLAATEEGFNFKGIEREQDYVDIARGRLMR
jgi:site-specific DNA-methyltransferase (adenine-specific)